MPQPAQLGYLRSKQMKLPLVNFLLGMAVTGAMAQSGPQGRDETCPARPPINKTQVRRRADDRATLPATPRL